LLSGKYGTHKRPAQGRLVDQQRYKDRYADQVNYEVAERFTAYAQEKGYRPASLAVAWTMSHPAITARSSEREMSSN
jgi:aryl-alcohol dehydrogenase-like predicted oxidoreductase